MALSVEQIRAQRMLNEISKGRRLRRRKVVPPRNPDAEARAYAVELAGIVRRIMAAVRPVLDEQLPVVVEEAKALTTDSIRQDALADALERIMGSITFILGRILTDDEARIIADRRARRINEFNKKQVNKQTKAVIGIEAQDIQANLFIPAFVRESVSQIKSIPEGMHKELERTITRGARMGLRHEEIATQIQERFSVAESKAKFIARDQVGSLNGKLSELRQRSIGGKTYIWRNSRDERVRGNPSGKYPDARPSHWDREGKVYRWDDPPKGGHPGEAHLCRCTAELNREQLLSDLGI